MTTEPQPKAFSKKTEIPTIPQAREALEAANKVLQAAGYGILSIEVLHTSGVTVEWSNNRLSVDVPSPARWHRTEDPQ